MRTALTLILGVAVLAGLVVLLYDTIRYSVISRLRTRDAPLRLRHPEPLNIEELTGFPPPAELVEFYTEAPFVERVEFYLVDHSRQPPIAWAIGSFSPLTHRDVREQLAISHNVPGIPIADDMQKGTYFVAPNGAVMLDSPNVPGRIIEVAPSISAFSRFEVRDAPLDAS